jgi:putative cardiolipin synthase
MPSRLNFVIVILTVALLCGCASLPPGADFPKSISVALSHPEEPRLGRQFLNANQQHGNQSAFRIIPVGADGFLIRMQMINAAERTLDLQYFIFRGDNTGRLLTGAVLNAADRGVRVRVLIDDGETIAGDEQITALEAHPSGQTRIFNPFAYRGHVMLFRAIEFLFDNTRLDYRMHSKLLIVDNAVALLGGRNIGDQYFQIDPASQFADDDIFAAGPIARQISGTFDEYWKSAPSVPAEALSNGKSSHAALQKHREDLKEQHRRATVEGIDYLKCL